ncbi:MULTISPECIES: phosphotransferase enzyme family protein [unclassified Paraflavitalea]|uniref:phosphotransferase enzyme family protein n=1 Tax=unclassified Paraflavitalea TaxID=2798305 RepID=UPI003D358991
MRSPIISVIDSRDVSEIVRNQFGLNEQPLVTLLKTGINHTYKVSFGGKDYVFRLYTHNWRTREEIHAELELVAELNEKGCSVSVPVATSKGHYLMVVDAAEGTRFAVLFTYARGQKMIQYANEQHFEIGKLMGSIHAITINKAIPRAQYNYALMYTNGMREIGRFLGKESAAWKLIEGAGEKLKLVFEQAEKNEWRTGVVHLDIWFDNLNIDESGRITLFDFDFCGNGPLALDMAYYIMQVHRLNTDESIRKEQINSFINGYRSVTTLPQTELDELTALIPAIYIFYLGVQCYRFETWTAAFLNEVYLERYVDSFVKQWVVESGKF